MRHNHRLGFCIFVLLCCGSVLAESGADAWLRYARLEPSVAQKYNSLPATIVAPGDSMVIASARIELVRGVKGMLGRTLREISGQPTESAIVLGPQNN